MHGSEQFLIIARMLMLRCSPTLSAGQASSGRHRRWLIPVLCLPLLFLAIPATADNRSPVLAGDTACPDLQQWYPGEDANWLQLQRELARLMPYCLDSAEYFALYGAAQLNSGQIGSALESLERALLMDPEHGAAQVDYAQALFLQGQVFSALDMNRQLLARADLPPGLSDVLESRHEEWRGMTRQRSAEVDFLLGHDSNLNRGPSSRQITLTLSGEPIDLTLSPEFQPVRGFYSNLRVAANYSRHEPGYSHNWLAEATSRVSEDDGSDISQFNVRYAHVRPQRHHSWQYGAALSHLWLGGSSLFTASEANLRYQVENEQRCAPYYGLAAQHQAYHQGNSNLDALEVRNAGGVDCSNGRMDSGLELGMLSSVAMHGDRPGGNRLGWQLRFNWQYRLPRNAGTLNGQLGHTELLDRDGYNPALADGARRELRRQYALLQYRRPLRIGAILLLNVYHQQQRSNISLFSSRDTAMEAGIRLRF